MFYFFMDFTFVFSVVMLPCRIVCIGLMPYAMHFLPKVFPAISIRGKWAVGLSLFCFLQQSFSSH
ncbi:hypothetical protein DAI22_07g224700 [Oryza sativa Japonica Group]|nr:hypothetical protein DAI22_07g224700 [Oryza sativa Japonica Group]